MKNRILLLMMLVASTVMMSSCLRHDLRDIPTSSNTDVTMVDFEYRYPDPTPELNDHQMKPIKLTTVIDPETYSLETGILDLDLTVPATDEEVDLTNIACYFTKHSAAVVKPLGDAPKLGVVSEWELNKAYQYRVTAGDGTYLDWTLTIKSISYK